MINTFRNQYYFLSNFYPAKVTYKGITFQNNEAAFQAQKCKNEKDKLQFASLSNTEARKLGRQISLRPDWEDIKIQEMRNIVQAKFEQNPNLMEKLKATGDQYLCEENNWGDKTWGTVNGKGSNLLGRILMETRDSQKTIIPTDKEEQFN